MKQYPENCGQLHVTNSHFLLDSLNATGSRNENENDMENGNDIENENDMEIDNYMDDETYDEEYWNEPDNVEGDDYLLDLKINGFTVFNPLWLLG